MVLPLSCALFFGRSGAAIYRFHTAATSAAELTPEAASAVLPPHIDVFYLVDRTASSPNRSQ